MAKLFGRHLAPVAVEMLAYFPGIVIEGARQVGKSTFASQIAAPDAVIANLDDQQTIDAAAADPTGFISQAGSRQLVIDEVQRLPELTLAIKAAVDRDRRPGRFIMTGSSSLLRVRGTADSLAGRVGRLAMFGLSQGETSERVDDFVSIVRDDPGRLVAASSIHARAEYAAMLSAGSYPELREMPKRVRATWIDSYLQGVVGRDLSELRKEVQPTRAMSILRTLAGRPAAELVKAKLAESAAVPASTITGYLDLLHDVGLLASVPPWTPNIAKREIGRPKAFLVDSALALRLGRVTPDQLSMLEYGEALGAHLEAFVAAELLRQRGWSATPFEVFHYRDRAGDEVDVVLELSDGSVIAIEVKAASSFNRTQFKGLAKMRDRLGDRFIAGVVLGSASAGYRYADRLYGAPVSALWNLRSGPHDAAQRSDAPTQDLDG